MSQPPPDDISAPIVHRISDLYLELYQTGKRISKRDRFGIWARIEDAALESVTLSIKAALEERSEKTPTVKALRIALEVLKRLVRLCAELKIIEDKRYFALQNKIIESSKMAAGWLAYLKRNPARSERGF